MTGPVAPQPIRVLVVEDDPLAQEAHATYVDRVPGFTCVARAGSGADALRLLTTTDVDLVLLDLNLPDLHGLDVCRAIRAAGHRCDVIAVTSARDLAVVRTAVSLGIVQYLLKPFVFASLKERLTRYAAYRAEIAADGAVGGQDEVDRMLAGPRSRDGSPRRRALPKGMSSESLEAVVACLKGQDGGLSAGEVGTRTGMSRVSARRYLEYLGESGLAIRRSRYGGGGGRPEIEYRWR